MSTLEEKFDAFRADVIDRLGRMEENQENIMLPTVRRVEQHDRDIAGMKGSATVWGMVGTIVLNAVFWILRGFWFSKG